ncbi:MAG: S-layer homology domain-containing protein [Clostridia bacterium]|nr:S-layer homology domain-containing protein [Clostridia bacterium]
MMKRMLCFMLIVTLVTLSITPVFANNNTTFTFFNAFDGIDYTADDMLANHSVDYNSENAWNGGQGFDGGWYPSVGSPASYMPTIRSANGGKWIRNYLSNVGVGRKLSQNIDTSADGEYYLSFDIYDTGTTDLSIINDRVGFGTTEDCQNGPYIYCGLTFLSGSNLCLKLGVGEDVVKASQGYSLSSIDGSNANEILKMKLKIEMDADNTDHLYAKMWKVSETEPTEWNVSLDSELSGKSIDMLDMRNNGTSMQVSNIRVEGFSLSDDSGILAAVKKLRDSQDITVDEANTLLSFCRSIAKKSTVVLKDIYTDLLKPYIEGKGWNETCAVKVSSEDVTKDVIHADEVNIITLNLSDNIETENLQITLKNLAQEDVAFDIQTDDKKVTLMCKEELTPLTTYIIDMSTVTDSLGEAVTPSVLAFTTSPVPVVNIKNNGEYGEGVVLAWEDTDNVEVTATFDGVAINNNHQILDIGEHTVVITAVYNGSEFSRSISFNILESFEPEATEVKISGNPETGASLTGSYNFSDKNNDIQGESIFKWYRSATADGEYTLIENANALTYELTQADENCYIKFEVTPVAESLYAQTGQPVRSDAFCGAFEPEIKNILVEGKVLSGEALTVKSEFYDLNNDDVNTKTYQWYISDSQAGNFTPIASQNTDKLTITEEYFEKFVRVGVTPVSTKAPFNGKEQLSEIIRMPAKPIISNVQIHGTATVGANLSAKYIFTDVNGDEESGSVITWINPATNAVIATGPVLQIIPGMEGMSVTLKVVGMSSYEPRSSDEVLSSSVVIYGNPGASSGGFGGGGGGGSVAGAGSSSYVPPVTENEQENKDNPQKPEKEENVSNTQTVEFADTKGHWAEEYISSMVKEGFLKGVSETGYEPDRGVSRAEFITMMMRSAKATETEFEQIYSDVKSDSWYAQAVMWAYKSGIISKAENFRPDDEITREEAAKILSFVNKEAEFESFEYSDISLISDWAVEYVNKAYKMGLMKGDDDGAFRPKASITRAEAAVVLCRIVTE